MNSSQREQEIFKAALALGTPEERRGFVLGACGGDQELRQRVEALLADTPTKSGNRLNL